MRLGMGHKHAVFVLMQVNVYACRRALARDFAAGRLRLLNDAARVHHCRH